MLIPKKVKHRKWWKGRHRAKKESRGCELNFGQYGIQVVQGTNYITSRQIEAARRAMTRTMKRGGKVWIRVFPDRPITEKGTEVPMGGGKGAVDHYVCRVKPGRVLFEIDGVPEEIARTAVERARYKLPVKTKFIQR